MDLNFWDCEKCIFLLLVVVYGCFVVVLLLLESGVDVISEDDKK